MLVLFLLYIFLVWTFSWRDLFQVTGTDASCVLYIICSQFITFGQVPLFDFWLNLIDQFTSEFSLSCADLCKVNTDDGDHVIS